MSDASPPQAKRDSGSIARLVGLAIVVIALIAFIVQNSQEETVSFLFFEITASLWLLVVVSAVLGAAAAWLLSRILRSRRG